MTQYGEPTVRTRKMEIKINKEILKRVKKGGEENSPANLSKEFNLNAKETIELIKQTRR